jgi:hypothetical protein
MTMALLSGNASHREGTGKKASIYFDIAKCMVVQNIHLAARHSFVAAVAFHFIPLAVHKKILIFLCDCQNVKYLITPVNYGTVSKFIVVMCFLINY